MVENQNPLFKELSFLIKKDDNGYKVWLGKYFNSTYYSVVGVWFTTYQSAKEWITFQTELNTEIARMYFRPLTEFDPKDFKPVSELKHE